MTKHDCWVQRLMRLMLVEKDRTQNAVKLTPKRSKMQQVAVVCRRLWLSGSLRQQRWQCILATATPQRWQRQFCSSSKAGGEDEKGDEKGLKDRRPIAARGLAVFQGLADRLAARNVSPNTISMWSIGAGFAACACFAATPYLGTHINRVLVLHVHELTFASGVVLCLWHQLHPQQLCHWPGLAALAVFNYD